MRVDQESVALGIVGLVVAVWAIRSTRRWAFPRMSQWLLKQGHVGLAFKLRRWSGRSDCRH